MNALTRLAIPLMWVLVFASCIGVIWSKHQARSLFVELQNLEVERDQLNIEWGQLKLEQSAWSTHGRVEQMARTDLKMVIPAAPEVRLVQP